MSFGHNQNGSYGGGIAPQSSLVGVMGAIGNLPPDRQVGFNRHQQYGGYMDSTYGTKQTAPTENADWWSQLPAFGSTDFVPPTPASGVAKKGKKAGGKIVQHKRRGKKQGREIRKDFAAPTRMDESSDIEGDLPPEADAPALINRDMTSPSYWTIGSFIVMALVFGCSIAQAGSFMPMSINPLLGPDQNTLLLMGAKYGPLLLNGQPWRFFTAIWLNSGVIHILIAMIVIILTHGVERDTGFWRTMTIFLVSGVYGFILSALFIPESVSVGSTGALYGFLGVELSDILSSWRYHKHAWKKLFYLIISIIVTIAIGFTPFLDNFLHVGGFVMGFLCALMLLPNLTFQRSEAACRGVITFLIFPITAVLFMLSLVIFFRRIDSGTQWCKWCMYINCINISGWCPEVSDATMNGNVYQWG